MMKSKLHWTTEISEKGYTCCYRWTYDDSGKVDIYQILWIDMKIELGFVSIVHICRDSRYGWSVLHKQSNTCYITNHHCHYSIM